MWLTIEEFVVLIDYVRTHNSRNVCVTDPRTITDILFEEYDFEGFYNTLSFQEVLRRYLPEEWMRRYLMPSSPTSIGQGSGVEEVYTDPAARIMRDLETLRNSPVAAFTYINLRHQGVDSGEAMNRARAAGAAANVITSLSPGTVNRAVSGTTGQPRNQHRQSVQQHATTSRQTASEQRQPPPLGQQRRPLTPKPRMPPSPPPTPSEVRRRLVVS